MTAINALLGGSYARMSILGLVSLAVTTTGSGEIRKLRIREWHSDQAGVLYSTFACRIAGLRAQKSRKRRSANIAFDLIVQSRQSLRFAVAGSMYLHARLLLCLDCGLLAFNQCQRSREYFIYFID